MRKMIFLLWTAGMLLGGCSHAISPAVMNSADPYLTFAELLRHPQTHQGKIIVLGGVIVQTENRKDGSLLEIYQTKTNQWGEPTGLDVSEGRFLVFHEGVLEPEIYRKGRRLTVAGRVIGVQQGRMGNLDYTYPYLAALEIRLWEDKPPLSYDPYFDDYWDPWYGGYWRYPRMFPYHYRPYSFHPRH
jgi:outer membrane lipoprotein